MPWNKLTHQKLSYHVCMGPGPITSSMSAESKRSSLDGHRQPEGSAAQYAAAASSQPENKSADMSLSAAQQSVDVSANPPLPPPLPASPAPLLPISPVSQVLEMGID